jgi:hypothetical protein
LITLVASSACHVFETVSVDCVYGQPCAGGATETAGETGTETGVLTRATVGWAVSMTTGTVAQVRAYEPDGQTTRKIWANLDPEMGPVAYDPGTGAGVVAWGATATLLSEEEDPVAVSLTGEAIDAAWSSGGAYVLSATNIDLVEAGGAEAQLEGSDAHAYTSFDVRDGQGWLVDRGDGADLLAIDGDFSNPSDSEDDFGDSAALSSNVVRGPGGEAFICSPGGALHAVADLAEGSSQARATYDGSATDGALTDVTDCGWDDALAAWLLFSPSAGVVRMDEFGHAELLFAPVSPYTLVRASFWQE